MSKSVMERMRERRRALQDTQESTDGLDSTAGSVGASVGATWAAAMDETTVRHQPGVKMLEDVDRADGMVQELQARRQEKKKELNKSLRTAGADVLPEIRSARKKSRDKVKSFPDDDIGEDPDDEEELAVPEKPVDDVGTRDESKELQVSQGLIRRESGGLNSLKEKLRSKVQSGIKGKLEAEKGKEDEQQPQRTLRGLRDRPAALTRFDENALTKEQQELEDQLSRSQEMRNKWKKVIDKSKVELPDKEEQMEFFTKTYDDEGEDEKRTSAVKAGMKLHDQRRASMPSTSAGDPPVESALMIDEDKDEDTTEDTSRLIPKVPEDYEGRLFFMAGAEYIPSQEKISDEREHFYVPSSAPVPVNEKVSEDCEARDLADEGLYVGRKPLVLAQERHKMEHRLLQEPDGLGKKWFGEDGEILSLPDPVKEIPSRPVIPEELDPAIQTFYRKAITKEFDSRYIDGTIDAGGQYRLNVDVNSLKFTHHDLMSREHVLDSRLSTLAIQYQDRRKANVVEYHSEKIRALKSAIVHLKENLLNHKNRDVENTDDHYMTNLKRRLKDYTGELRDLRKACDAEEHANRELLRHITKTWTSLKHLRSYQNCTNTPVKLNFTKVETNRVEDRNRIKAEIADEVEEQREEFQQQYEKHMVEYEAALIRYKQQLKAKKEATARIKRRKRQNEEDPEDLLLVEEEMRDQAIVDEPALAKPEIPKKFDEKYVKETVEEKFKQIKRRPGEPILIPEISYGTNVTSLRNCPLGEQQRREAVLSCRLYSKVFFNGKEVAKTGTRQLTQDFTVSFAQIIPIHIIQWPDSIYIEIYEMGALKDRYIATVYAAIPATTVTSAETVELDTLDFATEQRRTYSHEAVGSGVPVTFDIEGAMLETITPLTSGQLLVSVAWDVDAYGNPLIPVIPSSQINQGLIKGKDAVADIGASAMMDMDKLSKWLTDSRIDPNDPANSELVYLLRPKGRDRIAGPEYFRLEQLQEEFNFATDEELNADSRLQLLELREREVPEFRNMKMVPPNANEIQADWFKEYNERMDKEKEIKKMEGDSHRAVVTRFMQRVREQVLERKRIASHQKSLQEIVVEESVPNIATIVLNLGHVLAPRRPLRPRRKERKAVVGQNLQDREVKVIVNITRAYDVPCRVADENTPVADKGVFKVRPVFEVRFQREKRSTSVADGPNPSWNEELTLPFRAPNNDYSSTKLQTVTDSVYINLFDEYVTDVLKDNRQRGREIHNRLEKKWLGGIQIPFATLYANGVIEGAFRLDSPAVLLGYTRDTKKKKDISEVVSSHSEHTYVNLFITIEPSLGIAPDIKESFESNESDELLDAAAKFMEQIEKAFPTRTFTTAVIDINGKHVFVTKYFKPLSPPPAVLDLSNDKHIQMANVARYVSLIPYISDSVTFPGMCDLWSTCDQFLQMFAGDEEEHAVLLTNYFLHLGQNAYLCIGMAIPEGITAYTLVIDGTNTWVWNAMKGERYSASDTFCPLVTIGCLVNSKNIWANIQKFDRPNRMTFDLENSKAWRPFFTASFPEPNLPTVQPEQLIYFETDREHVRDTQERLEQYLKEKFEKEWRPRDVTRWNRNNMQIFRNLLSTLEENRNKDTSEQHRSELDSITNNYKLSGFTLNMPYTDQETIAESVKATGVWENDSPSVDFALAVHIHLYPHSVLSVWIYVASLERKRL